MPPYQEFFQRALAAQIGTIQLSSSSAGLHTPLDTGMTSPLWVRGGGGPDVAADESEAAPPPHSGGPRRRKGGRREQRCPIKCTFGADAEHTADWGLRAGRVTLVWAKGRREAERENSRPHLRGLKPPEVVTVKEDGLFACSLVCFLPSERNTWKRSRPSRCLPSPPGPAQRPQSPRAAGKGFVFQLLLPSGEITRRGSHQLPELKSAELVSAELADRFG